MLHHELQLVGLLTSLHPSEWLCYQDLEGHIQKISVEREKEREKEPFDIQIFGDDISAAAIVTRLSKRKTLSFFKGVVGPK